MVPALHPLLWDRVPADTDEVTAWTCFSLERALGSDGSGRLAWNILLLSNPWFKGKSRWMPLLWFPAQGQASGSWCERNAKAVQTADLWPRAGRARRRWVPRGVPSPLRRPSCAVASVWLQPLPRQVTPPPGEPTSAVWKSPRFRARFLSPAPAQVLWTFGPG